MASVSQNFHAGLIAIDGRGVLITGASGAGKTTLMLHLYRRCIHAKTTAHLVSDDQVLLEAADGRLIGRVPPGLSGRIEIHGFGIVAHPQSVGRTPIDLTVSLSRNEDVVRFWDEHYASFLGIQIKQLTLAAGNIEACGNAVFAALGQPLWL